MSSAVISALRLTDFRAYVEARLEGLTGVTYLYGPNGAGKTNLLEAVSWLAPGRGLRGASAVEAGRREAGETVGRAWAVSADLAAPDDQEGEGPRVGTGLETAGGRRVVRIDGQPSPPGRLAELLRLVWLTPAQDRLFVEGASERRRFLDRLVFADQPSHAREVNDYERASRERLRLLTADSSPDPAWLDALEVKIGEAGAAITLARLATVSALTQEIERRQDRPFPRARLALADAALRDTDPEAMADAIRRACRSSRSRDAAAGRALSGPHRADLQVEHVEKDRPAAECSTGEQKALLLNIVLAQAARLAKDDGAPPPVLLLDEVAAHLDPERRAALYDELNALGLQAFLTGVEGRLFAGISGGVGVEVHGGRLLRT